MLKHAKNTWWFIHHETPHDDASSRDVLHTDRFAFLDPTAAFFSFFFFWCAHFSITFLQLDKTAGSLRFFFFSYFCNRAKPPRQPRARQNFQLVSSRASDLATNWASAFSHFWRNQKVNAARCLSNPKEINPEDIVIPPNARNISAYVVSGRRTSDFMSQNSCRALRLR